MAFVVDQHPVEELPGVVAERQHRVIAFSELNDQRISGADLVR
jgi:hypothetical protein